MIRKFMNKNVTWGGMFKLYGIATLISIIIWVIEMAWIFGWFTKLKNKIFKKKTTVEEFKKY